MFCKECGKLLGSSDKFCPECGTRVVVEKPKRAPLEPMFFVEKREEPVVEKKPKRVIHLDEFNWDLDGYPTEKRKTEAVDFDWASVLEEKVRQASPKPVEPKPEVKPELVEEPLGEMPKTVEELLAALPDHVLEIVEEPEADEPEEIMVEEEIQPEAEDAEVETIEKEEEEPEEIEVKSLEQIIEDFGEGPMDEPTRLIDKAQMKADSVDRFYVFSRKQAEYQNLLDQEYDKIQNGLKEQEAEEEELPTPTVEEILGTVEAADEPKEPELAEEEVIEAAVEEAVTEEPVVTPVVEAKELELVAVAWSLPPAGIVVERETVPKTAGKDTLMQHANVLMAELEKLMPEGVEPDPVEETSADAAIEETALEEAPAEAENEPEEEAVPEDKPVEEEKEHLTFADIFNDEDEEEETAAKGGGCLKFIAVVLMILVILELGILGVQYFAPDSEAAKLINQTYGKVVGMIMGSDEPAEEPAETPAAPSEIQQLITEQLSRNENIGEVVENTAITFEVDKDYGYAELADTYAFKDSPWYVTEEGAEITYGDEIIGTLIQYYSALPDKINDVNKDVLDYVDNTTALYEELDAMEGDDTRGYTISSLEIGEIRTGQKGFYALVNVTSADKLQPEQNQQKQLVYLEANPTKNVIKIKETKNI